MTCRFPPESMVIQPSSISLTSGPKVVIGALHKAFSNFKFYGLKSVAEDDGGENIVATRAEFTGLLSSNSR